MKRKINILLIGFLMMSLMGFSSPLAPRNQMNVVRYYIQLPKPTPNSMRQLLGWLRKNQFDIAGTNLKKGIAEVVTNQTGVQFLQSQGLRGLFRPITKFSEQSSIDPNYLNPVKVEAALRALAKAFPQLTHLQQVGVSIQGRPIWALLISSTPSLPQMYTKPSIIIDGMHHAREVMTSEIVLNVGHTILQAIQAHNEAAINALSTWNVWIVPMLNVDGNNMVWTENQMWRKNARDDKGQIYGVDINRNYPFNWAACNGSSTNREAQDYHGTGAASEPETTAMIKLGNFVMPTVSLSYHSYGELVLYPYGCEGQLSGNNSLQERVGQELAAVLPSDSGSGSYTPGTPWKLLYSVDGDSMSFMHSEFGALAFTIEVNEDFIPAYSLQQPTLEKQRKGWQYLLTRSEMNLLAIHVSDSHGAPISKAKIDINEVKQITGEKPFQVNPAGYFFKVLEPGNYSLKATLPDGRTAQAIVQFEGKGRQIVEITIP